MNYAPNHPGWGRLAKAVKRDELEFVRITEVNGYEGDLWNVVVGPRTDRTILGTVFCARHGEYQATVNAPGRPSRWFDREEDAISWVFGGGK